MEDLISGTIQTISVLVEDRLGTIDDLGPFLVEYEIMDDSGSQQVIWTNATDVQGMRVDCLVDTTNWDIGHYELYIKPHISLEKPVLGPFDFDVIPGAT